MFVFCLRTRHRISYVSLTLSLGRTLNPFFIDDIKSENVNRELGMDSGNNENVIQLVI